MANHVLFLKFIKNAILLLAIILAFIPFKNALAAFNFGLLGGPILVIRACTCSGAQLLTIGPPRSGDFLFQPGISRLFSFYSIKIGSLVIGLAAPTPVACKVYVGINCVSQGQGKPILIMGTSK